MKPNSFSLVLFASLTYFATMLGVEAVVPAPDGGYPNFTTAAGQKALFGLTTGQGNTAVGWFTLESLTTGSFNTATGAGSLLFNTADQNTANWRWGAFEQHHWCPKHGQWSVRPF